MPPTTSAAWDSQRHPGQKPEDAYHRHNGAGDGEVLALPAFRTVAALAAFWAACSGGAARRGRMHAERIRQRRVRFGRGALSGGSSGGGGSDGTVTAARHFAQRMRFPANSSRTRKTAPHAAHWQRISIAFHLAFPGAPSSPPLTNPLAASRKGAVIILAGRWDRKRTGNAGGGNMQPDGLPGYFPIW